MVDTDSKPDLEIGERLARKIVERRSDLKNGIAYLRNPTLTDDQRKNTQVDIDNIRKEIDAYLSDPDYEAYYNEQQRIKAENEARAEAERLVAEEAKKAEQSAVEKLEARVSELTARINEIEAVAHEHLEPAVESFEVPAAEA